MRFLASAIEINGELERLLRAGHRFHWAVAWASTASPLFEELKKNRTKIRQLTVGTHFSQTDPDFIEAFMDHSSVRFVFDSSGVFHPKVYLFETQNGWEAIVGSANFTGAGLTTNNETAVLASHRDNEGAAFLSDVQKCLTVFSGMGVRVTDEELERYRERYNSAEHAKARSVVEGGQAILLMDKSLEVQQTWFLDSGGGHGISLGADVRDAIGLGATAENPRCRIYHEGRLLKSGRLNVRNSARITRTTALVEAMSLSPREAGKTEIVVRVLQDDDGIRLEFDRKP